ncbi:hypothetical protein LTR70_010166 [Exophiala xenobiotica]|uniref:Methyltransferase type 11 domain-containing protein n=1 Tax=Lithohypha guttulata TaxID=1690604 RepID=A0ABR0JVB0_9EURO|nr:hypothetical protein LTR24_010125 [Lithohypha guttulata]KAK5309576.1 hypothetical protein LTR70_010166 [Exophiala xenobiotica]
MSQTSDSARLAGENKYWQRAYASSNVSESRDVYDQWAMEYDQDVSGADYAAPELAAQTVVKLLGDADKDDIKILDAGCGTGLVGLRLRDLQPKGLVIDGLDLSQKMLDIARNTDVYRDLHVADLSQRIALQDDSYDIVVCVGTLTHGHVGPSVFPEFVRIAKKGGFVVATILDEIWESKGYKGEVERLGDAGRSKLVSDDVIGLTRATTTGGRRVVLRKL